MIDLSCLWCLSLHTTYHFSNLYFGMDTLSTCSDFTAAIILGDYYLDYHLILENHFKSLFSQSIVDPLKMGYFLRCSL